MEDESVLTNMDFSSVNVFWKIMEALETDRYPTEGEWGELFSTSGYKTLLAREFSTVFFKEKFSLAFMPSKTEELKIALESGADNLYLPHYVRVRRMKSQIMKYIDSLDFSHLSKTAMNAALSFLPQASMPKKTMPPNIAFVIFKNDARGYDPIVIDALASMEWGDLHLFLGHEFHHHFRNKIPFALNFLSSDTIEGCLVNTIISVESEGVADLINVDQQCSSEECTQRQVRYKRLLEKVPDSIRYLNDWILHNRKSLSKLDLKECKALADRVSDSGHQMGYYMAKAIIRHSSKESLIATVGRPFAFLKLYQKAAEEEGFFSFSKNSQEVMGNLENKYTIKAEFTD